jgi:DNA-binding HxlR family transcriptional regulator
VTIAAKPEKIAVPDVFVEACPSRQVLARVGEKWTLMSVVALADAPLRFGALQRRLEGVSRKVLSQTLRNLESDGLLSRQVVERRPLHVTYTLTPLGRSLVPLALALKAWSEGNLHEIRRANEAFSRAPRQPGELVDRGAPR